MNQPEPTFTPRQRLIMAWYRDGQNAINALIDFRCQLFAWLNSDTPIDEVQFNKAVNILRDAGLDDWLAASPVAVDQLKAALCGEPEKE